MGGILKEWDPKGDENQRVGPQRLTPYREGHQAMQLRGVPPQRDVTPKRDFVWSGAARLWGSLGSHPKVSPHKDRGNQVMELGCVQPQRDPKDRFIWGSQAMGFAGIPPQRVTP